jgi:hypothetical protein
MSRNKIRRGRRAVRLDAAWLVAIISGAFAAILVAVPLPEQLSERALPNALAHPAIGYYTRPTDDPVADLAHRIDEGKARLSFDDTSGYLTSVLDALQVPVESQMLVMSKTGVQGLHTDPSNPRAIYFTDTVTVGYIRGAPLLELAVQFYALDQRPQATPLFDRRRGCLTCHQVYSTLHVPGMLARSVLMTPGGLALSGSGSYDPDDRTPFRQRWGGWYVTGTHGSMRHMGNAMFTSIEDRESAISDRTLNRTSLEGLFDGRGYPSAHSDIVALMVFQHQARMINLITRVGWEARVAAHEGRADFAAGPLRDAVDELVDDLLLVDEAPLTATVKGTTRFAEMFAAQGPIDTHGRSLRQLDLERRLLRYPCSYMIYSAAFRALPEAVRAAVYGRMWEILSGRDTSPRYAQLSEADRRAVVEIIGETLADVPAGFRTASAPK